MVAQRAPAPLKVHPASDRLAVNTELLEAKNFGSVTPQDWTRLAKENDRSDADGIFLSCTNTRQIEAIADIEKMLGKPVVNSNQAVLWGCMRRLKDKVPLAPMPQLGRLMQSLDT